MKTVLITGVTGFIGRYTARQFTEAGWRVVGLGTRPGENAPRQYLHAYHQLLLPNPQLNELVKQVQPQVCIHCAGRASVNLSLQEPAADFTASLDVTLNLLEALRCHAPQCHLVYLSSAAVYGNPESLPIQESQPPNPISPYGFHKLMCEQLCREYFKIYDLPTAILRIFSAYGPGLRRQVLWDMCHKALTQPVLQLFGTGDESRDFIHGADIARAISTLVEEGSFQAQVYNLASGVETTIRDLAQLIIAKLERNVPIEFDGSDNHGNPINWQADTRHLSQLGFSPEVTLERGAQVYAQWCRAEIVGW